MIKPIAFYLPQYHPIPENDSWWGKGFTEWTNVAKAKELFNGHYQPRLPADLGFYDLRVPEVREMQATLAKQYGIYGFCYWHYWFGNGKRILERPFNEVLNNGNPDFPFCLAWANESWTGVWHGLNDKVLVEQTYPGEVDIIEHFYAVLPAFLDTRYITKNNKPVFVVYKPFNFDFKQFINIWNDLAIKEGLDGIYFISIGDIDEKNFYQEFIPTAPGGQIDYVYDLECKKQMSFFRKYFNFIYSEKTASPKKISFKNFVEYEKSKNLSDNEIPLILSGWDNTPRSGLRGYVLEEFTPAAFRQYCLNTLEKVLLKNTNQNFIFIKSWNEWAEGNYLEPDRKYGHQFLEEFYNVFRNYL